MNPIDWRRIGEDEKKIAEAVGESILEKTAFDTLDTVMMGGALAAPMLVPGGSGLSMGLDAAFDSYWVSDAVSRRTEDPGGMRLDPETGLGSFGSNGNSNDLFDLG